MVEAYTDQNSSLGTAAQDQTRTNRALAYCPGCEQEYIFEIRREGNNAIYFRNGEKADNGEIIKCEQCNSGLEIVIKNETLTFQEAPEEEEDWGE